MSKKMKISGTDFTNWMAETYTVYASQTFNGKRLVLAVNHNGIYKVTHGEDQLYQGSQRTHAQAAWESA